MSGLVLGIDFGSSNSCVSVWRPDKTRAKVIKTSEKNDLIPSLLAFNREGFDHFVVGEEAMTYPFCVRSVKRLLLHLDRAIGLPRASVDKEGTISVICYDAVGNTREFAIEEVIGMIITSLRNTAIDYLKRKPIKTRKGIPLYTTDPLSRVVLGIPANFHDHAKDALRQAAHIAGFEQVHFMVESTAAAMSYGLLVAGQKTVLVFDMGGGTTDISIMTINDGKYDVQYTAGQSRLGGQYLDELLLNYIKTQLSRDISSSLTPTSEQLLLTQCRLCKETLTTDDSYIFQVENVSIEVTRPQFEAIIATPLQLVVSTVIDAIQSWYAHQAEIQVQSEQNQHLSDDEYVHVHSTKTNPSHSQSEPVTKRPSNNIHIDEIVLVGGCSKIPSVQQALLQACEQLQISAFVGDSKQELCCAVNPMHAVVEGLAIRGAVLSGCIDLLAATGRAAEGEQGAAETKVLPAVQRLKNLLMLDCLPTTIGLLTASDNDTSNNGDSDKGKFFEPILQKGNRLPCSISRTFVLDNSHLPGNKRRNMVSLEIYEEIEEVVLDANIWSKEEAEAKYGKDEAKNQQKIARKYSYYLLRSVDVPIDNTDTDDMLSADGNSVDNKRVTVRFAVNEEGALSYSAAYGQVLTNTASRSNSSRNSSSQKQVIILLIYAVILAVLYLCIGHLITTVENGKRALPVVSSDDQGLQPEL